MSSSEDSEIPGIFTSFLPMFTVSSSGVVSLWLASPSTFQWMVDRPEYSVDYQDNVNAGLAKVIISDANVSWGMASV